MRRGEIYRVYRGSTQDTKNFRLFVLISRQTLIDSRFSTAICAPIYSNYDGLSTQVPLGINDGVKKNCAIYCDELMSIPKDKLSHFISTLSQQKKFQLNRCLAIAVGLNENL